MHGGLDEDCGDGVTNRCLGVNDAVSGGRLCEGRASQCQTHKGREPLDTV